MSYEHGVQVNESSAGARPAVQVDSALPAYVGTAMVHETSKRGNVNRPVLVTSLAEALSAFGPVETNWTLAEAIGLHFSKYESGPIVLINVLDPENAEHQSESVELCTFDPAADEPLEVELQRFGVLSATVKRWKPDGITEPEADAGNTGNGTCAATLVGPETAPAADEYVIKCTAAAVADPATPAQFQLQLDGADIGDPFDADGAAHVVAGFSITVTPGATPFAGGDTFTTTVAPWEAVDPSHYSIRYDSDDIGYLIRDETGTILEDDTVQVTATYLDPTGVDADDIIGSYDVDTGKYTGLEVVHQVYVQLQRVPTLILAPDWSHVPAVAAKIATVARNVGGQFRALGLVDMSPDTDDIATHTAAPGYKTGNGFTKQDIGVCWPQALLLDGEPSHLSVHIACLCGLVDADHNGLPYASPSNKPLQAAGACQLGANDAAVELFLTQDQAAALNGQGIVTARRNARGWVAWGNRTGIYPADTDPRTSFIPVRRMMNHIHNTIVLTAERDIDEPGNRRFVDAVVSTIQAWLNGLIAAGALVAATIDFREEDNAVEAMADGRFRFYVNGTPPSPARKIEFHVEYDPAGLTKLF